MGAMFELRGDVAVVVGGTGVLGGAMARALAEAGAAVAVLGRDQERGQRRVQELRECGVPALFARVDALDRGSLEAAREAVRSELGSPTVLVNAAGGNRPEATIGPGDDFCRLPLEAWRSVFDLNLIGGVLLPCQVFGEVMIQAGRGSIINIASMAGITPLSRVPAYSAAKAAVLNLTQWLAREWARFGVRVNAISPGFFPAEQNRRLLYDEHGNYTERGRAIIGHTPMGRFGEPWELSGAVVWLASARASGFVTGQNIVVDGGFSSMTI